MEQRFVDNHGVRIEYLIWKPATDPVLPGILLVPGMCNSAQDWSDKTDLLDAFRSCGPRPILAVSLRGRGQSDTPEMGWKPGDHHTDLEAVFTAEGIEQVYLVGHSVGGGYALGFSLRHPSRVQGIVIGDFPPFFPKYPLAWAERLETMPDPVSFDRDFPRRLAKEAEWERYDTELHRLEVPLLVLRALRNGALPEEDTLLYNSAPRLRLLNLNCGHEEIFFQREAIEACTKLLAGQQ